MSPYPYTGNGILYPVQELLYTSSCVYCLKPDDVSMILELSSYTTEDTLHICYEDYLLNAFLKFLLLYRAF